MTTPGPQNVYLVSNATGTIHPTVIFNRAPDTNDFDWPITQRWINTANSNQEYFLLNFISSNGVVVPNWVLLNAGTSSLLFLEGNTGGQIGPDVTSTIFVQGLGSITTDGNGFLNLLNIQLTGLSPNNVLVGSSSPSIVNVPPLTAGFVLTSNGPGLDPSFQPVSGSGSIIRIFGDAGSMAPTAGAVTISGGPSGLSTTASLSTMNIIGTLNVPFGGTGGIGFTAFSPICAGITNTSPFQAADTGIGTAGFVLTSNGAGALPSFQAPSPPPGSILQIAGDAGSMTPTAGLVTISGGTTGLTTTAAASTMNVTGTLNVAHGGTSITTATAFAPICGGTTPTGPFQSAATGIATVGFVLTSNGAGALPSFQPGTPPSSGFTTINFQTFIISGTYTPTLGMKFCIVEVVGGGGGGAGTGTTSQIAGGGGAGGYAREVFSAATIGVSKPVIIGTGGGAGNTSNGGDGGQSSLGSPILISADGGKGGIFVNAGSIAPGGEGGSASPVSVSAKGSPGLPGIKGSVGAPTYFIGGAGGSSFFGGGALSSVLNAPINRVPGNNASNYGSGGSGGIADPGGAGSHGYILITEYI